MQARLKTFETKGVKFHFLLKTSHGGSVTLPRRIHRSGNVQPRAAAASGRRPGSAPQPLRASGNVPLKVTFLLRRSGHRRAERILWFQCFHIVCFHYGGVGRYGGGCPRRIRRNGSRGHFTVSPSGAVAVWRHLASSFLKYRNRDFDIKNTLVVLKLDIQISCCAF